MDDNKLIEITDKIADTLGKEAFATISDSIGELITGNTQNLNAIKERDEKITKLEDKNEKLVAANGALLQKVPVGFEAAENKKEKEAPQPKISLKDAFDEKGNFRK